jgi:hypothetical protein
VAVVERAWLLLVLASWVRSEVGEGGEFVVGGGEERGAAERAGGLALVDPLVDAGLVEGVRAVGELADAVPRLDRTQAHRAHGGGGAAPGPDEVAVPDGGEQRLDGGSRRRLGRVRRVVVGRRRGGREAQRGEAEQDGVPEEVQQLQHQEERLRQDHAVAHRREPHIAGRRFLPLSIFLAGEEREWRGRRRGGVGSIYIYISEGAIERRAATEEIHT